MWQLSQNLQLYFKYSYKYVTTLSKFAIIFQIFKQICDNSLKICNYIWNIHTNMWQLSQNLKLYSDIHTNMWQLSKSMQLYFRYSYKYVITLSKFAIIFQIFIQICDNFLKNMQLYFRYSNKDATILTKFACYA
jgi:hypothetical protein